MFVVEGVVPIYSLTGICVPDTVHGMEATTFAALGEPSRFQIVELLRSGPRSVGDIAERLGIRQPQVSKHLRILGEAGVVVGTSVARHRIYRLEERTFTEIADWVGSFERLWGARLDALDRYLNDPERKTP